MEVPIYTLHPGLTETTQKQQRFQGAQGCLRAQLLLGMRKQVAKENSRMLFRDRWHIVWHEPRLLDSSSR